jgi:uncharacterized membrane protein
MTVPGKVRQGLLLSAAGIMLQLLGKGRGLIAIVGSVIVLVGLFRIGSHLANSPATHWKLLNIMMRLFGIMMFSVGIGAMGTAVEYSRTPETTVGISTLSDSAALDAGLVSIFCLSIGAFVLTCKTVRPDLGDPSFSDRTMRIVWGLPQNWSRPVVPERPARSWWTGDTRPPRNPK